MTDFITTTEAADRLGITRQTLSLYLRQGKLRGVKLGKEWRIPRQEFDRLLAGAPVAEGQEPQQAM
jgi:excisionase family DNA binding protein